MNRHTYKVTVTKQGSEYGQYYERKIGEEYTTARNSEEAKRNIRWRLGINKGRNHIVADDYYEYVLSAQIHKPIQFIA